MAVLKFFFLNMFACVDIYRVGVVMCTHRGQKREHWLSWSGITVVKHPI